ncbi:hypothetical protein NBRC111894_1709 [Sporolactobacillus inulinus]|uniref:Uncharacterized protein n=1 Tax=Sporolactobacillus inulinus TaxID=2078 RepID=A0A4Y1ZAT5_9BACL|nr:hypothetical protein NBRC111894_1709 [Sporolactobacillus inulinus]
MHKRKTSPYYPRNALHSADNRKNSAYFTRYLMKDQNT